MWFAKKSYPIYKVMFKRIFGEVSFCQVSIFFTMIGLCSLSLLWPIFLALYLSGMGKCIAGIHCLVGWLQFFFKFRVLQCRLGWVSRGHKNLLSHFYNVKNLWKPRRKPANLSHFRLQARIGQKFNRISIDVLQYKNGSKIFYDLLRPIPTYTEGSQIFKKIVIVLLFRAKLFTLLKASIKRHKMKTLHLAGSALILEHFLNEETLWYVLMEICH